MASVYGAQAVEIEARCPQHLEHSPRPRLGRYRHPAPQEVPPNDASGTRHTRSQIDAQGHPLEKGSKAFELAVAPSRDLTSAGPTRSLTRH